jgi:hypothetical protein
MNALAEDQLGRLRELLAGTSVSFGMYIGKTPERADDVPGVRLPSGASRVDYLRSRDAGWRERHAHAVHPPEERVARDDLPLPTWHLHRGGGSGLADHVLGWYAGPGYPCGVPVMLMRGLRRLTFCLCSTLFIVHVAHAAGMATEIRLERRGGVFTVPVRINGVITLDFVVDSGAAEVLIPVDVALTLARARTITEDDWLPVTNYQLADGSELVGLRLRVREMQLADHRVRNVSALIGPPASRLLLGQSFLEWLPAWTLDNRRHVLMFADKPSSEIGKDTRDRAIAALDQPVEPRREGHDVAGRPAEVDAALTSVERRAPEVSGRSANTRPAMPTDLLVAPAVGTEFARAVPSGLESLREMVRLGMREDDPQAPARIQALADQVERLPRPSRARSHAARALNETGLAAFHRNEVSDAIRLFEEAFRLDPQDVEVVNNTGHAYLSRGDLPQAEEYLLLALLLAPQRAIAWDDLGRVYALRNAQRPAVACLLHAYRFSRDPAATRRFLARVAEEDPHEAIRAAAREALASPLMQQYLSR